MASRHGFDGSDDRSDRVPARADAAGARGAQTWSVTALVSRLKGTVEPEFRDVWVAGEIADFRGISASGHAYFALKDGGARISAKVWRSTLSRLKFKPENGLSVVAHGAVEIYPPSGALSMVLDKVTPAGVGEMALAIEQLRRTLAAEGLFAEERKRRLPVLPRAIGLVTSRDGAAIRDFLRHLNERFPTRVVLAPSAVQGTAAPDSIAAAIGTLSSNAEAWGLDVIAVVRGGGSLEDLTAFQSEVVARAIAASRVPVVTGIGHEIDTTIADLVSDCRAKTPTDAADRIVPDLRVLLDGCCEQGERLAGAIDRAVSNREAELEAAEARLRSSGPRVALIHLERDLVHLRSRLRSTIERRVERESRGLERLRGSLRARTPGNLVADWQRRAAVLEGALRAAAERAFGRHEQAVSVAAARLHGASPVAILARGYSLARKEGDVALLRDAADLHVGDAVETRLARGSFRARVSRVDIEATSP